MPKELSKQFKKLGFFGGSFDPPHLGHLSIAQKAIEYMSLDSLLVCPAFKAPLRQNTSFFKAKDRLEMLKIICQKLPKASTFDYEIKQQKTSFTFDTICEVQKLFQPKAIFLIIGADQFKKLSNWRNIDHLKKMVEFLVFARESEKLPPPPLPDIHWQHVPHPLHSASSSTLREKIRQNQAISEDLPEEVLQYLKDFSLLTSY